MFSGCSASEHKERYYEKEKCFAPAGVRNTLIGNWCGILVWYTPEDEAPQMPHFEEKNEVFKADLFDCLDAGYKVVQNREFDMRLEGEELTEFCQFLSSLELTAGDYKIGVDEEGSVQYGGTHQFLLVYQSGATFEFWICRNYLMVSKTIMGFDSLQGKTYAYTPDDGEYLINIVADYFYGE